MSRYIIKVVFLEKPKRPINWSGGSKIYICNKLMSGCISLVGMSCIHKKSKLCWFFLLGHLFFSLPWYILFSMLRSRKKNLVFHANWAVMWTGAFKLNHKPLTFFCGLNRTKVYSEKPWTLPCGALFDRCAAHWTTHSFSLISVVAWSSRALPTCCL